MKTVNINLYNFSELSAKTQNDLIEKNRDHASQFSDWHESISEGFTEDMTESGFGTIESQFSGFYSQGDGACFTGRVIDLRLFMINFPEFSKQVDSYKGSLEISIIKRGKIFASRYFHSNTIEAFIETDKRKTVFIPRFETAITQWARTQSDKYYKSLEKYYDEITSDEYITEYLKEKEEIFMECGKIYNS